jgi:hypothetical protein
MFREDTVGLADSSSGEKEPNRRKLLKNLGVGAAALGALSLGRATPAKAQTADEDVAILNFALNLEYLEAEFYLNAVYGKGLPYADCTGVGSEPGFVTGGKQVQFANKYVKQYAEEIANDELHHVLFLRKALGSAAVARPTINIDTSFRTLARAAGLVAADGAFSPYVNDDTFLLGAFIFEDVGVTAYNGAGASITDKTYLTAATSILAVEAYHAASVRLQLLQLGLTTAANKISALRAKLSAAVVPGAGDDQGITLNGTSNIVPTDLNSLAFARTPAQVLNIVYGGGAGSDYLFYPKGMNGAIS